MALETDYLVVGAGASAMAFVDTLLAQTSANVVMVDRRDRPGGHWNDAYPFVRLHQPARVYGVNSKNLGTGEIEKTGLNRGLYGLSSGAEILHYFEEVMRDFKASGRVTYIPMSNYTCGPDGGHTVTSLMTGASHEIAVRNKVVNATHARTEVPSTHAPAYSIADGSNCVPLNQLVAVDRPYDRYVVVGSGKTGIDACLWLLDQHVEPSQISWIMPRDAWLMDRAKVQAEPDFFSEYVGWLAGQFEAIANAESVADLFVRLETTGELMRLDPSVTPTMYRCAIVSRAELTELRRIENVVRMGRVKAVARREIILEHGSIEIPDSTLVIDCSANGLPPPPPVPVFDGGNVNLLMVRTCQPLFSAALIAYVEAHFHNDDDKNALCRVVPSPDSPEDWLRMWAVSLPNALKWRNDKGIAAWMASSRLDGLTKLTHGVSPAETENLAVLSRYIASVGPAAAKLPQLVSQLA